ncbi:MAG: hypothetical protein ACXVHB_29435 [Solirubrobacteraceae bacterium]
MHGGPLSGNGKKITPQAPLLTKRLSISVSLRPPETETPVPTGPSAAVPAPGTLGLLSWTKLFVNTQHVGAPATGGLTPGGQAPFCGGGLSPFWLLVSNPSLLLSNSEFSTSRRPPEFDPE